MEAETNNTEVLAGEANERLGKMFSEHRVQKMNDEEGDALPVEVQSLSEEEIKKKVGDFTEVEPKKHPKIVEEAIKKVGEKPNNGQVVDVQGEDGYDYKAVYDVKRDFMVFKGGKTEVSKVAVSEAINKDVKAQFSAEPKLVENYTKGDSDALAFAKSEIDENHFFTVDDEKGIRYVLTKEGKFYKGQPNKPAEE